MTIAKKCIGCQSNKRVNNISYNQCKGYIRSNLLINPELHTIFRDKFCPCTECLVKATCTHPKMLKFNYIISSDHKCISFNKQILDFKEYVYKEKGIRIL
jgi:hypothetical protein